MAAGITKASPAGYIPSRSSLFGWVRESVAGAWQKGVAADPIGALTSYGAVYACISRIANDVAKLEPELLEEMDDGTCVKATSASPYWGVLRKPNSFQNRIQFYAYWLTTKLMYGNAYALKVRDARGIVYALYLLDPRRVTPQVTPEGDVYYSIAGDDLARLPSGGVIPASEIIHDRCVTLWHPLVGVSPIYACGMAATQGIRIQGNSAQFFENMSRPSGMLSAPGTIDEVTATRLKAEWEKNYSGLNLGRLAVLGDGLKYEPMTIPANDAQLIDQLKWTVEDVARAFGMPLYKIDGANPDKKSTVEALNQQYYSDCLQTHIEAIELCLNEGLALPAGYEVEFDLDGLIRMDSEAQADILVKMVGGGLMSPNEGRLKKNLAPKEGGDSIYLQQQYFSLEALAKRDAKEDPFGTAKPAPALPPADTAAKDILAFAKAAVHMRPKEDEGMKAAMNNLVEAVVVGQQKSADAIAASLEKLTSRHEIEPAVVIEKGGDDVMQRAMSQIADELAKRFDSEPACV